MVAIRTAARPDLDVEAADAASLLDDMQFLVARLLGIPLSYGMQTTHFAILRRAIATLLNDAPDRASLAEQIDRVARTQPVPALLCGAAYDPIAVGRARAFFAALAGHIRAGTAWTDALPLLVA